jgi:mono/diheme cytochrome c family protein
MTRVPSLLRSTALVLLVAGASPVFAQTPADDAKVEKGRTVYEYWCAPCHSSGRGNPGTAALAAKYKTRQPPIPALLTERTDLTPQSIRFFVRQGVSVMAPFRKTEITDADLDALSVFLTTRRKSP